MEIIAKEDEIEERVSKGVKNNTFLFHVIINIMNPVDISCKQYQHLLLHFIMTSLIMCRLHSL